MGFNEFIGKLFGNKATRDMKEIKPWVDKIKAVYPEIAKLSNDELRAKTVELKKYISDSAAEEQKKIEELKGTIETTELEDREGIFAQIDKLEKEVLEKYEKALDDVLPQAFAIVKDTARRFSENPELVVTATDFDRELAAQGKDFVRIEDDKAIWQNHWIAGGNDMVWSMVHYDVQLFGGVVLHKGKIAEMATGEGKTLVATLPVFLNALTGNGVHVVTVNDYLAKRDAEQMGMIHEFLGLKVGVVLHDSTREERQAAYASDITYVTNNELGFDYLRDNMAIYKNELVLRKLKYCIIDEVDSVLIDEARTPLIISGQSGKSTKLYELCDILARQLQQGEYKGERTKMQAIMNEEVEEDGDFIVNEKDKVVNLTEQGIHKVEKFFHIDNYADPENLEIQHNVTLALRAHYLMFRDKDYVVKDDEVLIVDEFTGRIMPGRRYSDGLHQAIEAKEHVKVKRESKTLATITFQNFFNKFEKKAGMTGTALTEEKEFREIYNMDVVEVPTNKPVIRVDYNDAVFKTKKGKFNAVVQSVIESHEKGQPVLVGTITIETSELLSGMLKREGIPHTVLNAKFHEKEAEIVALAGQHGAVTIATNMAGRGTDIKLDDEAKAGGLKIIGTERHESRRIDNQLRGRAGRQGDPGESQFFISLEDDLMRLFGSERLMGVFNALGVPEGEQIQHKMLTSAIEKAQTKIEGNNFGIRKRLLEYDDVMNSQRNVIYTRRRHALMGERIGLDVLNTIYDTAIAIADQFADSLDYEGFKIELFKTFAMEPPFTEDEFKGMKADVLGEKLFESALATYKQRTERMAQVANPVIKQVYENQGATYENIMIPITDGKRMYNVSCNLKEAYETESKSIVKAFQKRTVLLTIDEAWKEHLREMDELRHSVQNASYEHKDPLLIYKLESYNLFKDMVDVMNRKTVAILMRGQIPVHTVTEEERKELEARRAAMQAQMAAQQAAAIQAAAEARQRIMIEKAKEEEHEDMSKYRAEKPGTDGESTATQEPVRAEKRVGRNDLCPCGSGKKYKNCHGQGL